MTPYRVLQSYMPNLETAKAYQVGKYITDLTASLGLVPHVDPVHGPNPMKKAWYSIPLHAEVHKVTGSKKDAEGWHYDGDMKVGSDPNCCLVLWSSNTPTLIKYESKIYQPNPWDIIIFKNMSVVHRRPDSCPYHRWLFRQRVAVPEHMTLP